MIVDPLSDAVDPTEAQRLFESLLIGERGNLCMLFKKN